ncbi:Aquaporin SIP1-1 like [Quillaja saponaria]|uniref:Aquaporin SIP1-1 like n=1 Tax=Quillaja saponaria TaxID=32244 RepID=A0AAD7Q7S3_QUISA|nr:Aquaporin SIP1-1 like [Quillaja saponaria]KAJ7976352.1 Aquaporin SIP1-1 like [Quillaja saponaria]
MGAIKAAIGDAVLTFMWVFSASLLGLGTELITKTLGIQSNSHGGLHFPSLFITTVLVFILVFLFTIVGDALGGASFNPTGTASFYAAGLGLDTLFSMALRFPAQAAGAVGGALAVMEVMPIQYKHMLGGPTLKVDLHTGAIAEGVLTFLISFCVLVIVLRGPQSSILKTWLLAVSTVVFVVAGSAYTGPSMNPANAFGWAYVNNWHDTWEQFYVYWICPFIGAILAAWVFRVIFPPPGKKQKKAKKA